MTNKLEGVRQRIGMTSAVADGIAIAALPIAIVALAFAPIFIRLSEREISPIATIFNCQLIATVVLGLWNGLSAASRRWLGEQSTHPSPYTGQVLWILLLEGTFYSLTVWFWCWSLTQTTVANATILRNLHPVFVTLGGWLVWGKQFDQRFLIGMIVAMGGAIAIGLDDLQFATSNLEGDGAAIVCAIFFGASLLILERLRSELSSATIQMWRLGFVTASTLPILLLTEDQFFPYSWQGWAAVLAQGIIGVVVGQGLMVYCLKHLSSGFVAVACLLQPLLAACLAWVIFWERLNLSNWIAFFVVLLGIYLAKSSKSAVKV